jgi:hypothetical protein
MSCPEKVSRGGTGLGELDRIPAVCEAVAATEQARAEAAETIVRLEPRHITGYESLIQILETALMRARVQQALCKPGGF